MIDTSNGANQQALEIVQVKSQVADVFSPAKSNNLRIHDSDADDRTYDGSVDLRGLPVSKTASGGFKAAWFIIGVEFGERLAYYGIQSNLLQYLTLRLREPLPEALSNATNWSGVTLVMPIIGGFFADAYFGKYWTIAVVSSVYVLGLLLLTLSSSVYSLKPLDCASPETCPKVTQGKVAFFFFSLYLISVGTGGIKPCLEAFGADQFDDEDVNERKRKGSFFNWWYFAISLGGLIAVTLIVWIDATVSWSLGFGLPTVVMSIACVIFYAGTRRYRHKLPGGSPLTELAQVLVACIRNWNVKLPSHPSYLHETFSDPSIPSSRRNLQHTEDLKFLDKAAVITTSNTTGHEHTISASQPSAWKLCTVTQVEEAKLVMKLIPVWLTTFAYGVVFAQTATLFVSQVKTLDALIGSFKVPAASFQVFMALTVLVLLPVYEKWFVPVMKKFTGLERGITMLQRVGVGLLFSVLSMVTAALVEARRLRVASHSGLLDNPSVILPMSAFWIVPQYVLIGVADVFTLVGEQEFFYDQVPDSMRSLGMALYLSANGVGSFISSLLVTIVSSTTSKPWLEPANLNRSRVDLFYWLLAILSMINLMLFMVVAFFYKYKKVKSTNTGQAPCNGTSVDTGNNHVVGLQHYQHHSSEANSIDYVPHLRLPIQQ
ncbi:hypothetical protein KP509_06G028700 [Ceratopteris richardii]|uniref:Uncharacterized protein n=1 Tax=Ceratopteris richardii TaxID=49495 RepID=A0A8T2UMB1_CERRI|nr:hypothetical protein KP509_06G028700 [Ceratopteris richardii]